MVAFVPPNPKLFESIVSKFLSLSISVTISPSFKAGSKVSTLADAVMKLFSIIKIEYMASCTPVAPKLCPVKDLVELTGGVEPSPNIRLIASISVTSPAGVDVP